MDNRGVLKRTKRDRGADTPDAAAASAAVEKKTKKAKEEVKENMREGETRYWLIKSEPDVRYD